MRTNELTGAALDLLLALQSVHRELRKSGWDMTLINAALNKAGVSAENTPSPHKKKFVPSSDTTTTSSSASSEI
jgi:hypothetical protein